MARFSNRPPATTFVRSLMPAKTIEPPEYDGGPRRVRPAPGRRLTMADIEGTWHASGGFWHGVFAVNWEVGGERRWAPLHDFAVADQMRLIGACWLQDVIANGPGPDEYRGAKRP